MEDSPALAPATVDRLCCGGELVALVLDEDGTPLRWGRRVRAVTPAQRRALRARDRGHWRFPGCHRRRLRAHHVRFWNEGGLTDVDNLVRP